MFCIIDSSTRALMTGDIYGRNDRQPMPEMPKGKLLPQCCCCAWKLYAGDDLAEGLHHTCFSFGGHLRNFPIGSF
jgi:hypothetical protein